MIFLKFLAKNRNLLVICLTLQFNIPFLFAMNAEEIFHEETSPVQLRLAAMPQLPSANIQFELLADLDVVNNLSCIGVDDSEYLKQCRLTMDQLRCFDYFNLSG